MKPQHVLLLAVFHPWDKASRKKPYFFSYRFRIANVYGGG